MRVITPARLSTEKGIEYHPDHLRRLEKAGKFPKHVTLGPGRIAYLETEIDDWLHGRVAARDAVL